MVFFWFAFGFLLVVFLLFSSVEAEMRKESQKSRKSWKSREARKAGKAGKALVRCFLKNETLT